VTEADYQQKEEGEEGFHGGIKSPVGE
jgi:hypothetical protein